MSKEWIGVDLDGTLAEYDDFVSLTHIGKPIMPMVERVRRWIREGKTVRIFTARWDETDEGTLGGVLAAIHIFLESVDLPSLEVTNVKDRYMSELWDDRAVAVEANTGRQLSPSRRGN